MGNAAAPTDPSAFMAQMEATNRSLGDIVRNVPLGSVWCVATPSFFAVPYMAYGFLMNTKWKNKICQAKLMFILVAYLHETVFYY